MPAARSQSPVGPFLLPVRLRRHPRARLRAFLDTSIVEATCTSPNGRTDGHGVYIRRHPTTGETTCAFCGEPIDARPEPSNP